MQDIFFLCLYCLTKCIVKYFTVHSWQVFYATNTFNSGIFKHVFYHILPDDKYSLCNIDNLIFFKAFFFFQKVISLHVQPTSLPVQMYLLCGSENYVQ